VTEREGYGMVIGVVTVYTVVSVSDADALTNTCVPYNITNK